MVKCYTCDKMWKHDKMWQMWQTILCVTNMENVTKHEKNVAKCDEMWQNMIVMIKCEIVWEKLGNVKNMTKFDKHVKTW